MNEPLREVTNIESRVDAILQKGRKLPTVLKIEEVILVGLTEIDFGECIASTISQRKIGVTLRQKQDDAKVISLSIIYEDEQLNQLPDYIFGVRKQNAYEYFDEYKFKASQRGVYNFIVGVKTPTIYDYDVKGKLLIRMEGTQGTLCIDLSVTSRLPEIKCLKQLVDADGMRLIKLGVVRNKSKRQTKVVFKCNQGIPITIQAELLGMENTAEGQVDVKPKNFTVGGKGNFVLSFITASPSNPSTLWSCLRRILVLRVKDTNMHFHFPLEVTFYTVEGNQNANSEFQ